mgnify:CR=1 FL=1
MDETQDAAPAVPVKSGGGLLPRLLAGVGMFGVTLAAVVAGGFINHLLHPTQELVVGEDGQLTLRPPEPEDAGDAEKTASGAQPGKPALYFALEPPLVVNFTDGAELRFLQVAIEVMSRDEQVIAAVQQSAPLIRNDLILLFSNRPFDDLMSREGKEGMRREARAELERIVKRETGRTGIEALLFTSFVVQ